MARIRSRCRFLKHRSPAIAATLRRRSRNWRKSRKMLKSNDDPILKADAAGVAGRIALLENDPARAAQEYDRQADYFKRARKYREMALSLGSAGQAYLDANILLPAVDRFYRSARSLYAQGDELAALKMVEAALAAGEKAGDQDSLAADQGALRGDQEAGRG